MYRKCDGKDPSLIRFHELDDRYYPCDCGKVFDDVYHLTYYPHTKFKE
jgi:hypothetical protein